jgi:hypothetical protein
MTRACILTLVLFLAHPLSAQDLASRLAASDYRLSYDDTRTLAVDVHALAFFKDNEYGGDQATGYTLPGFWLQPRLTYQPLDAIRVEAGFHAMVFNGAGKYPCYAYHDIARWKGAQYQSGAHVLPFFRAQAQLRRLTFVLGDLYGGANHGLVEPLMNPEVNLTQDPEMGFQLLLDLPRYHLDAWINWQSFIFREDNHQEAFTVGFSQRIGLFSSSSNSSPGTLRSATSFVPSVATMASSSAPSLSLYLPIDVLIQHRGGEIDDTDMGAQTIDNAAIGLGLRWNTKGKAFNGLTAEALALGCLQQSGHLWPFDKGLAAGLTLSADFLRQLRLFATTVYGRDFCPLYGAPFFSTYSTKTGGRFDHVLTTHVGAEWSHTFAHDYVLGAKVDTYLCSTGEETIPAEATTIELDGSPSGLVTRPSAFKNNFSFGVFFRCSPRFELKRFKR